MDECVNQRNLQLEACGCLMIECLNKMTIPEYVCR